MLPACKAPLAVVVAALMMLCPLPFTDAFSSLSRSSSAINTLSPLSCQRPKPTTCYQSASEINTHTASSSTSTAAQWHRDRRQQMLAKYGDQIGSLERTASSQVLGTSLLAFANALLAILAIVCGRLANWRVTLLLALFPGSILSLWQLQILHDNLHGCLLDKSQQSFTIPFFKQRRISKKKLQKWILFWGSMPSIFGYYLYLQYGHLTHHQAVGNPQAANLRQIFESDAPSFEDGDVLFVAHRMKLKGDVGPRFLVRGKEIVMSISNMGFSQWKNGSALFNMGVFAVSFLYERLLLAFNDVVVALAGKNLFFPHKPTKFHRECATYCRAAVAVRALIWWLGGRTWHSLLFLYLAETLWSLPPHPAAAMFVTNHGSRPNNSNNDNDGEERMIQASPTTACIPSSSTYAGKWYSILTLGTNYHCEHHDFPTIPLDKLGQLRKIAPEYYQRGSNDQLWPIMVQAFGQPDYYACMNDMESIR